MARTSNPTIQKLVESRIELGKTFIEQSLPVMRLNEDFNSNILRLLEIKNKKTFRVIKNKVPAIWTDIIDDMISVYNTEESYKFIKDSFSDNKSLAGKVTKDDDHYPLMIYTDNEDTIQCVLAGKTVAHDIIYMNADAEKLLKERFEALTELRKNIEDKNIIGLMPNGNGDTTKKDLEKITDIDEWATVPLQVALGKIFYDIATKYHDAKDKSKVKDEVSIWHDPAKVYDALIKIADTHKNTIFVDFSAGEKVKSSTKNTISNDMSKGKDTNDFLQFAKAIRIYPSRYDFENMIEPEILRDILRLCNMRTDRKDPTIKVGEEAPSTENIPFYGDVDIEFADEDELMDMYDSMRSINVKNSWLYSFTSLRSMTHGNHFSAFNQLALIPDRISHLYAIANIPTTRDNKLSNIGDLEDPIYTSGEISDIEQRYNDFMSPEGVARRRHNWEVGRQPLTSTNKYYQNRLTAKEKDMNIYGNAGRTAEEIRKIRAARRRGMIRTSREINDDAARNRYTDAMTASSELNRLGEPTFNAQVYKDRFRKDISGYNLPTQVDASTGKPLPRKETLLRGYYHDFMASYDSFSDTGKATYDKLMVKLDTYAKASNEYKFVNSFRKKLLAVEAAYNIITSTGGNAKLYNEFCGNLATGSEVNGFFLRYSGAPDRSGIVQSINDALRSNNKYQKNSLELVNSNMEDLIETLNKVLDTLCTDNKEKDYLMLTARRKYKA